METLIPFVDSSPIRLNPFALRERMDRDGFFFFRGLLPREDEGVPGSRPGHRR